MDDFETFFLNLKLIINDRILIYLHSLDEEFCRAVHEYDIN